MVNDIRIQCINEDNNSVNLTSEDDHIDNFICRCLPVHFFLHVSRLSLYQVISFDLNKINGPPAMVTFKPLVNVDIRPPVIQKLDSTIHGINHYPADKC